MLNTISAAKVKIENTFLIYIKQNKKKMVCKNYFQ